MYKKMLLVCLILFAMTAVCSAEDRFIKIGTSETGTYYFDSESIKLFRNNQGVNSIWILDVWVKKVFTDQEKEEILSKSNMEVDYALTHKLIDLKNKKIQDQRILFYKGNQNVHDVSVDKPVWEDVVPASMNEIIYNFVGCWATDNHEIIKQHSQQ